MGSKLAPNSDIDTELLTKTGHLMRPCNALLLLESTENHAVLTDPANADWVTLLEQLDDEYLNKLDRRYYLALHNFRKQRSRPLVTGQIPIVAEGMEQAQRQSLDNRRQMPLSLDEVFVAPQPEPTAELPEALRDFSKEPPSRMSLLEGRGRPPCDARCLTRAFLAAPLLGVDDSPTRVYHLLHNNPSFAYQCGFDGTQGDGRTSRRLPSQSVCEQFNEVMTRYGLWNIARVEQVRANLASGVVEAEATVVFDTTHLEANSGSDNLKPANTNATVDKESDGRDKTAKEPKNRKVPRMRKRCMCGRDSWENCKHPWVPSDSGAAVVVKGPTRIYWAHKASVASFATSEVPFDVRVCQYAAQHDGKTLVPHLEVITEVIPTAIEKMKHVLADDAYRDNEAAVSEFGQNARLVVPVHGRQTNPTLAGRYPGISHFTRSGVPVCESGHRFQMSARDISSERYIWTAPTDDDGQPVCHQCPMASSCLRNGKRRHIRVPRAEQPHINWENPQHLAREQARYSKRTSIERAIKRLKVDLRAESLTHRDALRVQAHLDRKLLTLHVLLAGST